MRMLMRVRVQVWVRGGGHEEALFEELGEEAFELGGRGLTGRRGGEVLVLVLLLGLSTAIKKYVECRAGGQSGS
jgi:hypothetical protein